MIDYHQPPKPEGSLYYQELQSRDVLVGWSVMQRIPKEYQNHIHSWLLENESDLVRDFFFLKSEAEGEFLRDAEVCRHPGTIEDLPHYAFYTGWVEPTIPTRELLEGCIRRRLRMIRHIHEIIAERDWEESHKARWRESVKEHRKRNKIARIALKQFPPNPTNYIPRASLFKEGLKAAGINTLYETS